MKRRGALALGCAHCAGLAGIAGFALLGASRSFAQPGASTDWSTPPRLPRPDIATDEGGLWALVDREEARLRRSPFLMRDAALREYVQGIACRLAAAHCPDLRVYPVRTPYFNASMAPNGMMQVWSGLLLRVDNEAQLAAVIGHEIGHYLQRHMLDRLRDLKSRSAFASFIGMFGLIGMIGQMAALAGAFAFSRDQERDADRIGIVLMRGAGYDPREAAKVWANLRAELAASPGGDPTSKSPMFATHPPSEEREKTLAQLAEAGSADGSAGHLGEEAFAQQLEPFLVALLDDELKRGQYGETLALLDRRVQRTPQRPELYTFRAETRRLRDAEGDADAALADLDRAGALGNEPAQAHRTRGYILQRRPEQAEAARAAFARYVELVPQAPDAALIRSYLSESPKP